jgi:glycosyltransferase involved in cell wall biosynthesis
MKVCILTTAFPRWADDIHAPFIFQAARAIYRQGIRTRVIAMHSPGAAIVEEIEGVEILRPHYLPERYEILRKESAGLPELWRKNPFARLAIIPFVIVHAISLLRYSQDCDLIHAQWTLSGMISWIVKPFHRKPYIVSVHGSDIFQAAKIPVVRQLTRLALTSASAVIAVSKSLADAVADLGVDRSKIIILPNGVDTSQFIPADTQNSNILFVGSLTKNKGVHYLLQAFAQIAQIFPEMRLQIIGDGSSKGEFQNQAMSLGISHRVDFFGQVPPSQVRIIMRQALMFVLPSLSEGFGVVILEAMASGIPCIGSRVGGIPDLITPDTGILVDPMNSQAIADAMRYLLENPDKRKMMSTCARLRSIQDYDWLIVAKRYIEVYKKVINSYG